MRRTIVTLFSILFIIASCSKKATPTTGATATATAAIDGAAIFAHNCARCHGAHGVKDSRTPNLPTIALDKDHLVQSITNGKIEPGKNKMPSFQGKLSPQQISAVADLIVSWHQK